MDDPPAVFRALLRSISITERMAFCHDRQKLSLDLWDDKTVKWEHGGKLYCLHVRSDDVSNSPREDDDGLITIMACFHSRYDLGDREKVGKVEPDEFWQNLVRENVKESEILAAAEGGNISGVRIVPSEDDPELYDIFEIASIFGNDPKEYLEHSEVSRDDIVYYLLDDLTVSQCMALLKPYAEWLPLWLYDHSGITMSCGARTYPYDDAWDSGQVGWIVTLKKTLMEECGIEYVLDDNGERIKVEHPHKGAPSTWSYLTRPLTDKTWRRRAVEMMKAEVEAYDQYLRGDVYGYDLYQADAPVDEDNEPEWEEIDSCWGFYGTDIIENGIADQAGNGLRRRGDEAHDGVLHVLTKEEHQ